MKLQRWDAFQAAAKYDPLRNPIIHIGAHHGEEKEEYSLLGYKTVLWVEAQEDAFAILEKNVGSDYCLQRGLWNLSDLHLDLHVTNNSVSTSFYELNPANSDFKEVREVAISKVNTITLADAISIFQERGILIDRFVLRLDVQGSEYRILKSSTQLLSNVDFICCEVTGRRQIYKGTESRRKIVILLLSRFWIPAFNRINPETSHGETIFIPLKRFFTFFPAILQVRTISLIDRMKYHFHKVIHV